MRNTRGLIVLILPFLLAFSPAWSADAVLTDTSVTVFPLVDLSPGGAQKEHQKALSEAVRQEFAAVGFRILTDEAWSEEATRQKLAPGRIIDAPQVLLLGQKAGADMAVSGFFWKENDRILVSLQCYDVDAGTLLTGFLHTWRFNLGFYNSIRAEIADLVQKVVFLSAPRLITLKDDVRVDEITFASPQNGMEVVVEGQKSVGRIQDGTLVFPTGGIKAGTPLRVEKRQEGYHALWQTVIAAPEVLLTPLPRKNILSVEVNWTAGQLQGAGATLRWYPVPDWIMINFSEYIHTQVPVGSSGNWPIHVDSTLLAGLYLFRPPEAAFRFGISAGIGAVLTFLPSVPVFTDLYVNVLSIWGEWRLAGIPMFARMDLKIPLGVGNNLLGQSTPIHWGGSLPPVTLGVVIPWR